MIKALGTFLCCCLTTAWALPAQEVFGLNDLKWQQDNGKPEFFTIEWVKGTVLKTKETALYIEMKDMGPQTVELLSDQENPVLYAANIDTPVCADGECRIMYLRLYWNLLGKYVGYDRVLEEPLTKHDHDPFLAEDYEKLHHLLQDGHSILRTKDVEDLVDRPEPSEFDGVDAVVGATITEVKESVVEGALYSCYTAWHLVHGDVKENIRKQTGLLYNKSIAEHMLMSNEYDYQLFALERLKPEQFMIHHERIINMLKSSIPLVRTFIIKNLPEEFWSENNLQERVWACFPSIDVNSKSLLLRQIDTASVQVLEMLSVNLGEMSKNQLRTYLKSLENKRPPNKRVWDNLEAFAKGKSATYAYIVSEFLENYKNQHPK